MFEGSRRREKRQTIATGIRVKMCACERERAHCTYARVLGYKTSAVNTGQASGTWTCYITVLNGSLTPDFSFYYSNRNGFWWLNAQWIGGGDGCRFSPNPAVLLSARSPLTTDDRLTTASTLSWQRHKRIRGFTQWVKEGDTCYEMQAAV